MAKITRADFYRQNRDKLREKLAEKGLGLAVIAGHSMVQASADRTLPFEQDGSFFYLTGIEEPGLVLVIDGRDEYLIVPGKSSSRVAFEGATDTDEMSGISGIEKIYDDEHGWNLLMPRLQNTEEIGILSPSDDYMPSLDMFTNPSRRRIADKIKAINESLALEDVRPELVSLRMVKSDYEIGLIEKAIEATSGLLNELQKNISEAANERELMAGASAYAINKGLKFSYEPIIACGKNAVTLHYEKNNSGMEKDCLLLLDIGLKYDGYCSDITRTVAISGKPSARQQEVYDAVLDVHDYAMELLKPGVTIKEFEQIVAERMAMQLKKLGLIGEDTKEAVRAFYPHATSHFLGIDVHDVADYTRPLEPGMVLTVEPGIYIAKENIGVRIEDDVLITENGYRNLSKDLLRSPAGLTIKT